MRRGRAAVALAAVAIASSAAGCGGSGGSSPSPPASSGSPEAGAPSGPGRFLAAGFRITFDYPAQFTAANKLEFGTTAGAAARARTAVGLDRHNVIVVSRYDLRAPVTTANVAAVQPEVDGVLSSLAGRQLSGKRVDFGGLPGFEYRVPLTAPAGAHSRVVVLFDEKTEYFFNCQSTPDVRYLLEAACRQALRTLKRK